MQIKFSSPGRMVVIQMQSEVSILDFQNVSMFKEVGHSSVTFEGFHKVVHDFLKLT